MFTQYKSFRDRPLIKISFEVICLYYYPKSGSIGSFHTVYLKPLHWISYNEYLCEVCSFLLWGVDFLGQIPKISYFQSFFNKISLKSGTNLQGVSVWGLHFLLWSISLFLVKFPKFHFFSHFLIKLPQNAVTQGYFTNFTIDRHYQ